LFCIVSLQAGEKPLHKKQAVKASGRDGFSYGHKAFNRHLPHFLARSCLMHWGNLPSEPRKHLSPTFWQPAFDMRKHLLTEDRNNLLLLVAFPALFPWLPV
jgi:hypothetical protein